MSHIEEYSDVNGSASFTTKKRIIDLRFQSFNTRHADLSMPRRHFAQGATTITNMTAEEYFPLICQLMIVLGIGNDDSILPRALKLPVVNCLFKLCRLRLLLWQDEMTEADLANLNVEIER